MQRTRFQLTVDTCSAQWIVTVMKLLFVAPVFPHTEVDGGFTGNDIPFETLKF